MPADVGLLMSALPEQARAAEPNLQSLAQKPEALVEFEKVPYKYDSFHDEPGAESLSFTK